MKFITTCRLLLFTIAGFLFVPSSTAAARLVPCDGPDCDVCDLVSLGNNVITWILAIVFVLFAVVIFVAGVGLVTSGGNQTKLDDAKKKLSSGLIGIIISFSAWLIVDTLMKAALPDGRTQFGPWNTISCENGGDPFILSNAGCTSNGNGTETCIVPSNTVLAGYTCTPTPPPAATDYECSITRPE